MADSELFHCSVVTPERAVFDEEVRYVSFPAHDGEIGILRNRAPLLCRLGIGVMRVDAPDGLHTLVIDGGFAQMVDNRLTILTEQAKEPQEVDRDEAHRALMEAQSMRVTDDESYLERQRALQRARMELRLAEGGPQPPPTPE
jgi:F-type H+-transporting ATPase subunit epsilon